MKIALFVVYFGKLPPYTQLFLASCEKNRDIDFLLIGDQWESGLNDIPENCRIHSMDLDAFKSLAEKKTGIKPAFTKPYKICDYKPVLGEIFQDMIPDYDYWGFCDTDVVLGDVSSYLRELGNYDVFSTRAEYLSGPLFFMRNSEAVNGLYRKSKDYLEILTSDAHFCFDECAFVWHALKSGKKITDIETATESMTEVIVKAVDRGEIRAYFETLSLEPEFRFPGQTCIEGVNVTYDGEPFILLHHVFNKERYLYTFPKWNWKDVPDAYFVNRFGAFGDQGGGDFFWRARQSAANFLMRQKKQRRRYMNSIKKVAGRLAK